MHRIAIGVFSLCLLAMAGPVAARGLAEAGELEHARANARAGGPISSRDSELLERHGCLSGTNSAFCKKLVRQRWQEPDRSRLRR